MSKHANAGRAERLDEVLGRVRARLAVPQRAFLERFVAGYYAQVDPEDLAERSIDDLYGAALSHWQFARRRPPGSACVRAFNPSVEEHGWQSTHTVLEIVNDDMPFLVDSVTMELNRQGLTLHLIVHPILAVRRAADGALAEVEPQDAGASRRESFIHAEVDRLVEPARLAALAADLGRVLRDVRLAVTDWQAMRGRLAAIEADLAAQAPPVTADELDESRAFLRWLAEDHFTFLGYRCHDLVVAGGEDALRIVPGSGLGILREDPGREVAASFAALPPEVRAAAHAPELLIVTKANARSTVHRARTLDYVGVKRFDAAGRVCGEHRFLGLFTSMAYRAELPEVPLLRRKAANVIARAGVLPGSHAGKALVSILGSYPRDELFQTSEDDLLRTATGILHLGDRQRFRLFLRRDAFERFVVCMIYSPRETYTTELRKKWQAILLAALEGTGSEFNVHLSESALARVIITVRTTPGRIPAVDERALEARLAAAARRWDDALREALIASHGEAAGNALLARFDGALPVSYREEFSARAAVPDIELMARLTAAAPLGLSLYRPLEAEPGGLRFKLFHLGGPVPLSDSLPMLERMGLRVIDERPHRVAPAGEPPIWLHDFGVQTAAADAATDVHGLHAVFEDAFGRIFRGEVENDDFNRLVVAARLPASEIVVLRAYAKYLRQTGFTLSQGFIEATLAAHPEIARALVELFKARFDPARAAEGEGPARERAQAIEAALEGVENLSEDRALRQLLALVLATTRTNFWRTDAAGCRRAFVSFKFDPQKVPGLPEPRPMFEIFVYSPRFEGVHLRGGRVARGGLRWSDRPEDFRTEVLGLMKAQMVKNTVIVPVGSKGGFVLKRVPAPADRDATLREGKACYQDYLRALLDLTDNRAGGQIVPPPQVRRYDPDDPYLVVAADKGTATFSDLANAISREYGFWLDDAFASGGSAGYDHKAMGITARGAWESAKRHFREMGRDTQAADFTVVGIGDMSGDVFGNGLLLSPHVRLLAAFDHRHIFLDPDPDPAASRRERERLFALARSSWADYDPLRISAGGGVHARSAKAIALTPQVKAALAIEADALTPAELIHAILKAPVDLLYNGGIGTYVKATAETHAQAGDRANDAVRVDGRELRCKVLVEGGNLGCTQLGRIEFARAGGRICTDAIDNSGGVDASDHEVNIKILLGLPVAEGELTVRQRNALLAEMTGEVAALVLRDNYYQTQVLSVSGRVAPQLLDEQQRFIRFLEKSGRLHRALEFLPADEDIAERRAKGEGLARPERAVLLAYAKMWLYDALLASPLPDDPWVASALERYFPAALVARYAAYLGRHPLRREIVATHVTNSTLNRIGSTLVHRLMEATGAPPHEIVRAYLLCRETLGFVALWNAIDALDNRVEDALQAEMLIAARAELERGTAWFLRGRRSSGEMAATIARFRPPAEALSARWPDLLDAASRERLEAVAAQWRARGVPAALAARVANLEGLSSTLDIVEVAEAAQRPVELVAEATFALATRLELPWLRGRIAQLPADRHWKSLARGAMLEDLAEVERTIVTEALTASPGTATCKALLEAWEARSRRAIERAQQLMGELRTAPAAEPEMLAVALRELRNLA